MARILRFFMWGIILGGLTSCGHKKSPEPTVKTRPSTPALKVNPLPSLQPVPMPQEPSTHKIGLLLPLSGPQATIGKGLLEAAEMALFETGSSSITLVPEDTHPGAHQAALKALDEGAELLLGPVFAAEVEAIKPLLSSRKVNLLSFSTDQSVAGNGSFILGFLPSQQIERVTSFAKEKGITKLAALTPDDQYGRLIDQTLKYLEVQGKIQLLGISHYTKGDLLEGNPGNTRLIEEIEGYKVKGLEALLIPEGGENLAHLTKLFHSQMPLKVIGSGQWDTPETLRIASTLKECFFASPDPQEHLNFETRFQQTYGYTPPRIASLAYDATALAVALADKGYTLQNITFSQGFSGTDGIFRLTSAGLNERGLAILEVTPSGFKKLSPAPTTF
ncbi:MAG: penicillin-binding protein activator [Proteobacteria bacterium]|nr:penicillin-binding protein activator [Pseudomonadota bacterium]